MNVRVGLAISIAVISVWAGAANYFDVLVGPAVSKVIVALSSLTVATLGAVLGVLSGQSSMVSSVAAMPGVSKVVVNENATPNLAAQATGPNHKIEPEPGKEALVRQIAADAS